MTYVVLLTLFFPATHRLFLHHAPRSRHTPYWKTYSQFFYIKQQEEELNNRLNNRLNETKNEDDMQPNIKCIIDPSDEEFDNLELSIIEL